MTHNDPDVLIVGAGGSGLAAAVSCAQHGLSVLVLEACAEIGGTTGIAVGSFTASQSELQRKQGITDSPEQHANDLTGFAPSQIEARNNSTQRAFFTKHVAETMNWLQALKIKFVGPVAEPPNRHPRMHNVIPGAKAYIARLQIAAQKQGVEIRPNSTVTKLIINEGHVIGAEYQDAAGEIHLVRAQLAVVLAAGDYANNSELIKRFKGGGYENIEGINPHATGLGHLLAESVGARMVNMDVTYGPELRFIATSQTPFQQWLPVSGPLATIQNWIAGLLPDWVFRKLIKRLLVTWQHPEDALFEHGAILINRHAERFCDELDTATRNRAVSHQDDRQAYILLSADQVEEFSQWPHFISTAPDIAYAYIDDYLRLRPDVTLKSENLRAISQAANLPLTRLVETANSSFSNLNGPWVLLGPVKSYFTTTEGSPAINEHMQVLNTKDRVIEGLYAVGQCGLNGMILWSHGCHIAWAMTSGRLVGESIALKARR